MGNVRTIIALVLALLWAAWWIFFGLASGIGEGMSLGGILIHAALPGGIMLISVAVAWMWKLVGGELLVLEGIIVLIGYPIMVSNRFGLRTIVFVMLTMALPPLLAGILLVTSRHKPRASGSA
jgi:hypothetical protein